LAEWRVAAWHGWPYFLLLFILFILFVLFILFILLNKKINSMPKNQMSMPAGVKRPAEEPEGPPSHDLSEEL
jgi:hypothetical protein